MGLSDIENLHYIYHIKFCIPHCSVYVSLPSEIYTKIIWPELQSTVVTITINHELYFVFHLSLQATEILKTCIPGSFLLRKSKNPRHSGTFTISVIKWVGSILVNTRGLHLKKFWHVIIWWWALLDISHLQCEEPSDPIHRFQNAGWGVWGMKIK